MVRALDGCALRRCHASSRWCGQHDQTGPPPTGGTLGHHPTYTSGESNRNGMLGTSRVESAPMGSPRGTHQSPQPYGTRFCMAGGAQRSVYQKQRPLPIGAEAHQPPAFRLQTVGGGQSPYSQEVVSR
eukprot:11432919-Heterocapsa_arctica.AAC.1